MQPENLAAVRLGVASHNLFTLAYGLVLAAQRGGFDRVQFEMLEGMANHQRRALVELAGDMLLYAPACRQEEFINAIGYLVRRLDENTGPDNFLRHAFNLEVDSPEWRRLEQGFRRELRADRDAERRRRGGRRIRSQESASTVEQRASGSLSLEERAGERGERVHAPPLPDPRLRRGERRTSTNEPDTDWSLPQNSDWAADDHRRAGTRATATAPPTCRW